MSEWIEHTGDTCPVPDGTLVDLMFRNGHKFFNQEALHMNGCAARAFWKNTNSDSDIVRYRLSEPPKEQKEQSDGKSADYYKLPDGATQLQDLIAERDMNAQIGEIFRACYRYGLVAHSPKLRDINKILFYAQAEKERLEKYENGTI